MENIIKYVKNRETAGSGETPYLNLEDSISVNRGSTGGDEANAANYSSLQNDSTNNSVAHKDDDSGTYLYFFKYIF